MSKQNGRLTVSVSMYQRHVDVIKRLATQAQLTESEIVRELIEVASNCSAEWEGPCLRLVKPKFLWEKEGRYL